MPKITIDGKEYDSDTFSDDAKSKLVSLQVVDRKIMDLDMDMKILQTARNAYAKALEETLPKQEQ